MRNGKEVWVSMTANPSHLEAVNPVVEGKVRAKQTPAGEAKANEEPDRNAAMRCVLEERDAQHP